MKNTLVLLVFLSLINLLYSQQSTFKLDENSPIFPNQYVVLKVDSLSINRAYAKTLEWIRDPNNFSEEVIKAHLDGKYIKIEDSGKLYYAQSLGLGIFYTTKYYITFSFKKGMVKFEVTKMSVYFPPTDLTSGKWVDVNYQNKDLYKARGKFRKLKARKYNVALNYFNDLSNSLKNYLVTPAEYQIKEDYF